MSSFDLHRKWITGGHNIHTALIACRDRGFMVAMEARPFGPVIITASIDDVADINGEKLVLLKDKDVLGVDLPLTELRLSDIRKICLMRVKQRAALYLRGGNRHVTPAL